MNKISQQRRKSYRYDSPFFSHSCFSINSKL